MKAKKIDIRNGVVICPADGKRKDFHECNACDDCRMIEAKFVKCLYGQQGVKCGDKNRYTEDIKFY